MPELPVGARSVAIAAARDAGAILMDRLNDEREIVFKGAINIVTDADRAAEALILGRLRSALPDHQFIGEEESDSGVAVARSGKTWCWLVDPLDGTTNYAHGYPHFAVSIGLEHQGKVWLGVVFDPTRDELFVAERGKGATLNDEPLHVSSAVTLLHALLATGFNYQMEKRAENIRIWNVLMYRARGLRRDGSAALDLCYVAAGRLDGYWERGVSAWDTAAGALLVEEAGGVVTGYGNQQYDPFAREVVAANSAMHPQLLSIIQEHCDEAASYQAKMNGSR